MGRPKEPQRKWLLARDALALLRPHFASDHLAKDCLVSWCKDELVESRCDRLAVEKEGVGKVYYDNEIIYAEFWTAFDNAGHPDEPDWVTGKFVSFEYDPMGSRVMRAHGVEFSEDDIRERMKGFPLLMPPSLSSAPKPLALPVRGAARSEPPSAPPPPYRAKPRALPKPKGRVSAEELRAWFQGYVAENRDLFEGQYVRAANTHFSPRQVGRDRVRDLIREFNLLKNRENRQHERHSRDLWAANKKRPLFAARRRFFEQSSSLRSRKGETSM